METIKKIFALLICTAMTLSMSACGSSTDGLDGDGVPESTRGKDVERAASADNLFSLNSNVNYSFNPVIATNHSNQLVCNLVYENMVELDNNFEAIPNVLESWIANDDATYWTFTVAKGHYFSDGTEVSGKDIRYSLDAAINSDRYRGRISSYQGSGYDEDRFYVTLGIGDTQFVKLLNIPIIKIGSYDDKKPMGSGPYKYNEDETELVINEYYPSASTLPVDRVPLVEYSDAASIISAFDDGIIDVVTNDPSSYTNLGYASTNEIHNFATTNLHYVMFNEETPVAQNSGFRQAMNYAFDRANWVSLMHGNGVAANVPMYPTASAYPATFASKLNYNLETVKLVLENSGIKDYDEDGRLEYMSGSPQKININFIVCSDSSAKTGVVKHFQSDMESIGLKVTVNELTWDEYLLALEEGNFDMYYGEVKLRANFDLSELLDPEGSLNFSRSKDKAFLTYINNYLAAPDATRSIIYQQLCEYVAGTGALIPIGFEQQQIILHRGVVKGVNANLGNPLYDFPNWKIDLG